MSRAGRVSPEWSLIFFTVLAQAAAGVCVFRAILLGVTRDEDITIGNEALLAPLLPGVLVLLTIAGLAACLHLGRKGGARFALANIRSSWLSREILLVLLLGLAVAARSLTGLTMLDVVAAILGILLVVAISRLYMVRTVPAWNVWTTPPAFFGTMLLLGSALTGAAADHIAYAHDFRSGVAGDWQAWLSLVTLATAVSLVVTGTLHFRRFTPKGGTGGLTDREIRLVYGVRVVSLAVAALLFAFFGTYGLLLRRQILAGTAISCFLLLVSELIGRFIFYASYRRVGL